MKHVLETVAIASRRAERAVCTHDWPRGLMSSAYLWLWP